VGSQTPRANRIRLPAPLAGRGDQNPILEGVHGDQEWDDIKKATRDRGALVGEIQDRTLLPTDYSPVFS
jgi:hypothetical protein